MTAEELQRYVLDVHAPRAREESLAQDGRPDWFRSACDSTCSVIEEELGESLAPLAVYWWGGYEYDMGFDGHCWFQAPDGTIVDPTSEQYGLPPCLISRPGDATHARYRP